MTPEIEAKTSEIENYRRILSEYQSGRWYDVGRRRLAELEAELEALTNTNTPEIHSA